MLGNVGFVFLFFFYFFFVVFRFFGMLEFFVLGSVVVSLFMVVEMSIFDVMVSN